MERVEFSNGDPAVEYRLVPMFPMYCVGNDGSVWSRWGRKCIGWKRMATPPDKDGYPKVLLQQGKHRGGGKRHTRVHTLVLELFIGPCPENMESCHKDGSRTNCCLDNLRYGTHQSNINDRTKHGTTAHGERHGTSKLTTKDVLEIISLLRQGALNYKQIADRFGVSITPIHHIAQKKTWKHIEREILTRPIGFTPETLKKAVAARIAANKRRQEAKLQSASQ